MDKPTSEWVTRTKPATHFTNFSVALPLSPQFARNGVEVLGLDVDKNKVDALNAGKSYIKHIEALEMKSAFAPDGSLLQRTARAEEAYRPWDRNQDAPNR